MITYDIGFSNLEIECVIGVNDTERVIKQKILVDIEVQLLQDNLIDDINSTVSYTCFAKICREVAVNGKFMLIEAYAKALLDQLFIDDKIMKVSVVVKKNGAIADADYASVKMSRSR
jgi:7,8-dihydroneopterin aldolase/epimerase/oxygenase